MTVTDIIFAQLCLTVAQMTLVTILMTAVVILARTAVIRRVGTTVATHLTEMQAVTHLMI
jgi:hypothetical protein